MSKKEYQVKQQVKFNGNVTIRTFTYNCDESEISAIVALLEGRVTVLEQNVGLSSAEDASDLITGGLPVDSISMVHSEAKTKYMGAYGKPIVFKQTTSVVELQNTMKLHKPFTGAYEAEHPDDVYVRTGTMSDLM